jgi:processive 1,2-diacylglycerol beta-glucosyltransferase
MSMLSLGADVTSWVWAGRYLAAVPGRVLIISAAIGEGHDLPARVLAEELEAAAPGTETSIIDGLAAMGWPLNAVADAGSSFHSEWGSRMFDVEYWLITHFPPTRWLAGTLMYLLGARRLLRRITAAGPDVVVSTYPGASELLGRLRRRGQLRVPAVSAITDLAALRYWSHPGVDLHLVTHPESVEEVRSIAGDSEVVPVRGLNSADFLVPRDRLEARRDLGLPEEPKLVVVSGGGWAVGDLSGAVETALAVEGTLVLVLCGRNEDVRRRLEGAYGEGSRVRVVGFTDRMGDLLAAADVLVHSTAGLTVLEAHVRGCPTISYGWGRAHIRANNEAFARFGLAEVAADRAQLAAALRRALGRRSVPDLSFAQLPSAASLVLERIDRGKQEAHRA